MTTNNSVQVFQSAVPADKVTFSADEVKSIEVRAYAGSFRAGWRGAVAVLGPLLDAANEALVRKPITLDGVPGTGWHNDDDARTFLAWFERVHLDAYKQGHAAGGRDGAREATKISLALLSLKGCRTAGDLLRTALPAWVLP